MRPFKEVVLAAALAVAFCAPALAEDVPDADKWHVGETASTSGVFCPDVESASRALAFFIVAESAGVPFPAFLQVVAKFGCQYARNLTVTFEGVADAKTQVSPDGTENAIVEFSSGGVSAFSGLSLSLVSDQPLGKPEGSI